MTLSQNAQSLFRSESGKASASELPQMFFGKGGTFDLNTFDISQGSIYGKAGGDLLAYKLQQTDASDRTKIADKPHEEQWSNEANDRTMELHQHVSPDYSSKVQHWWNSVPQNIYDKATHAGIRVIVVNNAKDVIPNADHIPATGHRATGGETIAQQPMFYEPTMRAIIFAEHPDPTGSQQIRQSKGVQEIPQSQFDVKTANHELGHGLDFAVLNHITKSPEFDHAYDSGLAQLNEKEREQFHYYTDSPKIRAEQETFAQIYALTHTSLEQLDSADKLLLNKFSKVVDLMKEHGVISKDWEMPKLPK